MNELTERAAQLLAALDELDVVCRVVPWDEGRLAEHVEQIWTLSSRVSELLPPRADGECVLPRPGPELLGSLQDEVPHAREGDCRALLKARDEFSNWVADYFRLAPAVAPPEPVTPTGPGLSPGESEGAQPTGPVEQKPIVALFGEDECPTVRRVTVRRLAPGQYSVVRALLEAGAAGLTKDELVERTEVCDPVGCLKNLRRKRPEWMDAIVMPGGAWKGGYRIKHE